MHLTPEREDHAASAGTRHRPKWLSLFATGVIVVVALVTLAESRIHDQATLRPQSCARPVLPARLPVPMLGEPMPAALLHTVTAVCPRVRQAVGGGRTADGSANAAFSTIWLQPNSLPQVDGKPTILYVGGEFCPYCAAERWALLNALARFGTFSGITYMRSADDDGAIATLSFAHATYASPYLSAVLSEVWDRDHQPFQTLSSQDTHLWTTLGNRKVPFIDINGHYLAFSSNEDVDAVSGLTWFAIARGLSEPKSPVANWLLGKANALTALLCTQTGNQPPATCQEPEIQSMEQQLQ